MTTLTPDTTVRQSDDQVSTEIDNEVVLMSIEKGAYFGLNRVMSRIWKIIETPVTVSHLCAMLQSEYDVTEETCIRDVMEALGKMAEKKLITLS